MPTVEELKNKFDVKGSNLENLDKIAQIGSGTTTQNTTVTPTTTETPKTATTEPQIIDKGVLEQNIKETLKTRTRTTDPFSAWRASATEGELHRLEPQNTEERGQKQS